MPLVCAKVSCWSDDLCVTINSAGRLLIRDLAMEDSIVVIFDADDHVVGSVSSGREKELT